MSSRSGHLQAVQEPITVEWLRDVARRLQVIATEVEKRHGDNAAGTYPSELEMLLHMTHLAAVRRSNWMAAPGPADEYDPEEAGPVGV